MHTSIRDLTDAVVRDKAHARLIVTLVWSAILVFTNGIDR